MDSVKLELVFSAVAILVSIGGIIFADWRARHPAHAKAPRWSLIDPETNMRQKPVVSPDQPLECRLTFWNAGFDTILAADVSPDDPFRIVARDGVRIESVRLVGANSRGSHIHASETDAGEITIAFDYLRPDSGGVFAVKFTGVREHPVCLTGELIQGASLQGVAQPYLVFEDALSPAVRDRLGDRWAYRLFIGGEGLITILGLTFVVPPDPGDRVGVFLTAFILAQQFFITLSLLRSVERGIPDSLREFARLDVS